MDIKSLVRDASKVHACLQELPDARVVAVKPCKIYVPSRFSEHNLAEIGVDTYIVGIYVIVVEDKYYGVSLINAMHRIVPTSTIRIKIDGEEYFEFFFEAGQTVFATTYLLKNDVLVYRIYDEILSKGKIPWYINYDDLGHIFDSASFHGGANIGKESEVTELIVSLISRNKKNMTQYYRTTIKSLDEIKTNPPEFVALKSVVYAATNTTNKLAGSYFATGVVSALVSPAERKERLESILTA